MKNFKHLILLLLATVMVFGCSKYDDAELRNNVNDLQSRVTKLEEWCKTTNTEISALRGIITALEAKDYVMAVTPIIEGSETVGYTITFSKSGTVTIKNNTNGKDGLDGATPIIGVAKHTDNLYYWTVKVGDSETTWMRDADNNMIRTTGNQGTTPVMSVAQFEDKLYWQVDGEWLLNGDQKVPVTGDKGDAIFAKDGIDYTTDPENVTFTLADGTTKITLPKSSEISIGFDSYDTFYCSEADNELTIILPLKLKETDYNAIVATISNENGTDMDIQPRSVSANSWGVEVVKPTFVDGVLVAGSAKVKLILPQDQTNYKAFLKVTLIDAKGKEHSVSRVVWFKADKDVNVIDNTTGTLAGKISNPSNVKQLSVIGTMMASDFVYIKDNMKDLEVLDLSRTTITEIPEGAMAFYNNPNNGWNYTTNVTLKTIILPESLTKIGNSAFAMCANLLELNIPKSVRTLGRWMFEGCSSLEEVKIPQGITELPASAFYASGIKQITIPSSVTTIGSWAFNQCNNLTSITIPATVTSLGESVLRECANLESAAILANVDALQFNFFMDSYKLKNVTLSQSISTLNANAFCKTGLTEFAIPSHITSIGEGAFSSNTKLQTVTLPAGVQTKWNVFYDCTSLKNVTIAEGVTELGAEIFRGCTALESIELPSTMASIHDRAFQGCSALKSVICKAATAPILSEHNSGGENYNFHFYGINASCVLKRPAGADYSGWSSSFSGGIQNL